MNVTPSCIHEPTSHGGPGRQFLDARSTVSLLDELSHGAMLVAPDARLLYANRTARQAMARRLPLVEVAGQLQARGAPDQAALEAALLRAAGGRRSLVSLGSPEDGTLTLAVFPLAGLTDARPIAVVLSRAAVCDPLMLCFFARAHGLTPTEEQVLALLCEGLSAPEVAARQGVAVSTVRSHVRSLCARTGATGARALVQRVAVLPPVGSLHPGLVH